MPIPSHSRAFTYVTYVNARPERVFESLTSADFTRRYWFGHTLASTWDVGAEVTLTRGDGTVRVRGEVLVHDAPRTLSYTFPHVGEAPWQEEGPTRVTFTLEPDGEATKLVVLHDGFPEDSERIESISNGWPAILSNLKTLLETNAPIAFG